LAFEHFLDEHRSKMRPRWDAQNLQFHL